MKKESRERNFSAFLFLFSIKIITFAGDLARTVKSDQNRMQKSLQMFHQITTKMDDYHAENNNEL